MILWAITLYIIILKLRLHGAYELLVSPVSRTAVNDNVVSELCSKMGIWHSLEETKDTHVHCINAWTDVHFVES